MRDRLVARLRAMAGILIFFALHLATMAAQPSERAEWRGASPAAARADHDLGMHLTEDQPKDMRHGIELLTRAAAAGHADAADQLGQLYSQPSSTVRDDAKALVFYKRAVALGNAYALVAIGLMYERGQGVAVDHREARRWYDEALARGLPQAMAVIGSQYDHGFGVAQDSVIAVGWYTRAAAAGDAGAMSNLAFAYEFGRGAAKDLATARALYEACIATEKAEGQGDWNDEAALVNLAGMYLRGDGGPVEHDKAIALLQRGAEAGLGAPMRRLAVLEMDKPKPDGALIMRLLRRAVTGDDPEAPLFLAEALEAGYDGKPDYVEANVWYAKAAAASDDLHADARASAAFGLGQNLLHGRGIAEDLPRARILLGQAAAAGHDAAAPVYAYMLLAGLGGPPRADEALAALATSDAAGADMIRASVLAARGEAGAHSQAADLLAARARKTEGAATMSNPWDCNGELTARSAAYDLAVLSPHPDLRLMRRAAEQGDARAGLWLGEASMKRGEWDKADALIYAAAKAHLGAAFFSLGRLLLADGERRDTAAAADDFIGALAKREPRVIDALTAAPPSLPRAVVAVIARRIATDAATQRRLGARSLAEAVAVARRARDAEPAVVRTFCAVVHP